MRVLAVRTLPLLIVLGMGVAGCGDPRPADPRQAEPPATATSTDPSPATPSTAAPDPAETADASPGPGESLIAGHYHPLWPFAGPAEATAWRRAHQADGREAWHLDAGRTAVAFSRDYLGFTEIDQAVKVVKDGEHARVHVGYRAEEGPEPLVAAVVHLMRYGKGKDAPWEVVGTDDTSLTLTRPAYGASASSPLTVGGRITGVDESIRVQVLHPGADGPLGERCCLSAGGEKAAWTAKVDFTAQPGGTLTVVASTGGHVATVERFAVTGVTMPS
ncbi:hypothetical protein AB0M50_52550 [Nonomuraea fuscirosea]|uniref:hypothetical protein n=1 Tax=Nonomuraea fuscirosea TaxID=1291556 RepID=UPI002DDA5C8F|nr:hypothetical protein [Nonomuraea fuscirosea]WSA56337.1 hypothetical protein OIE67_17530 [Nonomuraea fuscirosea]